MNPSLWRRLDQVSFAAGAALLAFVYIRSVDMVWSYTVDDAYITMRHARNLVEGHGFVFNVGGPRVESYTNFLLLIWQVLALLCGGDPLVWTKCIGAVGGAMTLAGSVGIACMTLRWDGERRLPLIAAMAGPAWLVCTYILNTGATAGLETTLFSGLLSIGTLCALCLYRGNPTRWSIVGTIVLLGLATWTRPEGIFWAFLVLAPTALVHLKNKPLLLKSLIQGSGVVAFWLALLIFRLAIFGHPHPNTYYAKMGSDNVARVLSGIGYLRDFAVLNLGWLPLLFGAIGVTLSRGSLRIALGVMLGASGAYLALVAWQGGDWIPHLRFIAPVAGILAGLASAGLALALGKLPATPQRIALGLALVATLAFPAFLRRENSRATNEIQVRVWGWKDGHTALAEWLASWENQRILSGDDPLTIIIEDVGLVGWHTRSTIIDTAGLTDPVWAHYNYEHRKKAPYPAKEFIEQYDPEAIVLVGLSRPDGDDLDIRWETNLEILRTPLFQERYQRHGMFVHKDFPGDGYFLHVFVRKDLAAGAPPVHAPIPRARRGWGDEKNPPYFSNQ